MIRIAASLVVAFFLSSQSLAAQETHSVMDMDAALKAAEQLYNPAGFAVTHRKELSLTGAQVNSLDSLSRTAHFDIMDLARHSADEKAMDEMLMNTSIPIDDELVRKGIQAKVERETKSAIDRARMDRQVAGILTGLQRVAWASLRMTMFADVMSATSSKKQ